MLSILDNNRFLESEYDIEQEALNAALFTTGNGYIGVRGSFEEFGSLRIQGAYIRGLIDEVIEIIEPFADNEYMKKYYLNEEKLKDFEKQECVVNFADILLIRISVGGETFYPWEGEVLSWERYLDMENATLTRKVRWKNSKGNITSFKFERFSSFDNDHLYCQRVEIIPENHNEKITVISGIDTRTKTTGQKICKRLDGFAKGNIAGYKNTSGEKYKFEFGICAVTSIYKENKELKAEFKGIDKDGLIYSYAEFPSVTGAAYSIEKNTYIITSRECQGDVLEKAAEGATSKRYYDLFEKHKMAWDVFFSNIDIKIEGDLEADAGVRFSNYHSAISISKNDSIHSLSAKSLSGERYNNFVWWDCEVYQLPIFIFTVPEAAKKALIYRYNTLSAAKENARKEGLKGAKYAFVSSVGGEEKVWSYVRHPFLQIHITADVAWGFINYYNVTGDKQFMIDYGIEVIIECARYFSDIAEKVNGRYEIKNVTGTDEHHPYVDNDAYTNYLVSILFKFVCQFLSENGYKNITEQEMDIFKDISDKLYLPYDENGYIPQFDNYFSLSRTLESAGGAAAKQFQMKQSGLYHKSQVIKQPDVMLLFSHLNVKFSENVYRLNWDYYEKMCESSSSLSFPVHSICSADNGRMLSSYNYLLESAYIDIRDIHKCGWQGIHAGCAAGAWYAIFRGICGVVAGGNILEINPKKIPWWNSVSMNFHYKGTKFNIILNNQFLIIKTNGDDDINFSLNGNIKTIKAKMSNKFEI